MYKNILGLCTTLMAGTLLYGQQQVDSTQLQQLDEVVVSDSRFALKREYSGKTVIRIGPEELERNQGRSLAELITTKSGLEISGSRGRAGEILGVYARGGRGRQVLVLIDGVRISDPSSFSQEYDLRMADLSDIASIEIIKGATSTLYGTNATTAVISITTRKASPRKIAGHFQSSIGTNQTTGDRKYSIAKFENYAGVDGTLHRLTYSLDFSNAYSNGLSSIITPGNEEDPFSRIRSGLRLGYRFSDNFQLAVYGNQVKLKTDYDEAFGMVDAPYMFTSRQERLGVSAAWLYAPGEFRVNMAYASFDSQDFSAFPASYSGYNYAMDIYNSYVFSERLYTVLGLNYVEDNARFTGIRDFTLTDPYANIVYIDPLGFHINAGARLNLHSEYGSHAVFSFNPSYTLNMEHGYLKLVTSYATAYITPSLTQLFGDFGANAALMPEDDRTLEAGLEVAETGKLRASMLYFNRSERDFVYFDNQTGQYMNATNTIDAQGLEGELRWQLLASLHVSANYTYTERKGDNAIRIPRHKVNTDLGYRISARTYTSLSYAVTGRRRDTDFTTFSDVTLDSYSLLGCYIAHEVIPGRLKFFLDGFNLLNTGYTEVLGYTTRGRNVSLGIRLDF